MNSNFYNLKVSDYRISVPFTSSNDEIENIITKFKANPKSVNTPIPDTEIVDILKVSVKNNNKEYFGVSFLLINLKKILKDLKLSEFDKFSFRLLNNQGIEAKYCDFLKKDTKYLFHYDGNSNLIVL